MLYDTVAFESIGAMWTPCRLQNVIDFIAAGSFLIGRLVTAVFVESDSLRYNRSSENRRAAHR